MNVYKVNDINDLLANNSYVGRGIIIGKSEDGKYAITAYFIEGRSANSQNRIFVENEEGLFTKAFDETKVIDPSLIIYSPMKKYENKLIVTNGDQTDTIYEGLKNNKSFMESLMAVTVSPVFESFVLNVILEASIVSSFKFTTLPAVMSAAVPFVMSIVPPFKVTLSVLSR